MKRKAQKWLSLLLAVCMMLGCLPVLLFGATAEEAAGKDYDQAAVGDLLYTVDFSGKDGMFKKDTSVNCNTIKNLQLTDNGHKITFADKATGAGSYYVGSVESYKLSGHVYTVDFYLETSNGDRVGSFMIHDGSRMAFTTLTNNTNSGSLNYNGNSGRNATFTFDRKVDTQNNRRQYFRYVIDGTTMNIHIYALDKNDKYALHGSYEIKYQNSYFKNYLYLGMHSWDILTGTDMVALGDVKIYKGDLSDQTYKNKYDSASTGDVLYSADFRAENQSGFRWGSFCNSFGTHTISEDGASITLDTIEIDTNNGQRYSAWLPDSQLSSHGNYTYEFFVSSNPTKTDENGNSVSGTNPRMSINVLGLEGSNCIGFSFFDTGSEFCYGGNFVNTADKEKELSNWGVIAKVENGKAHLNPDTSDPSKPNVKIEFDIIKKTATCYVLDATTQSFVKTKSLTYTQNATCVTSKKTDNMWAPLVFVYCYNTRTNAMLKDFKVVKGLSVSGQESSLVELVIDGKFKQLTLSDSLVLPAIPDKDFYQTIGYTLNDGTTIKEVKDLPLKSGYNLVELTTKYEAIPVKGTVELRGVQSSKTLNEDETTNVRFVAVIDSLDFAKVGFLVAVRWKDADGVIHGEDWDTLDRSTTSVNTSVIAENGCGQKTATSLGGKYVYTLAIDNVPAGENVQVEFTVAPYTLANGVADDQDNYTPGEGGIDGTYTIVFVNGQYREDILSIGDSTAG